MSSKGHTYEECSEKADALLQALDKEGYNGHDMMFIAVRIFEGSIIVVNFEAAASAKEAVKNL